MSPTFADLGVPDDLARRLAKRNIIEPYPIQSATLVDALAGRDVCGKAPTGSGKTLAFGIPLIMRAGRAKPKQPHGLVLAPTRELAAQIERELREIAGPGGLRIASFYGGVGFGAQVDALRKGIDIAVGCPGRLNDLVERRILRLDGVRVAVVDEADRMADMGFLPVVRRLLDATRVDRQTLLFSATLDGDIDVLVRNYQKDPVRHEVEMPESEAGPVEHLVWNTSRERRIADTQRAVERHGSTVVFCRTKRGADRVAKQLAATGLRTAAIHGDRSQVQRDRALAAFAAGRVHALVATDVAARGIHVDDVGCVVHFDLPADPKDYVHRSGRTGRAGNAGTVVAMVLAEQQAEAEKLQRHLGMLPAAPVPVRARASRNRSGRRGSGGGSRGSGRR